MPRKLIIEFSLVDESRKEAKVKIINDIAFVHMEKVKNPDNLVIIADFFMKLAEVAWSIVSGIYKNNLIIIFRSSGLGNDAGIGLQARTHPTRPPERHSQERVKA